MDYHDTSRSEVLNFNQVSDSIITQCISLPGFLSATFYILGIFILLFPIYYLLFPNIYSQKSKFGVPKSLISTFKSILLVLIYTFAIYTFTFMTGLMGAWMIILLALGLLIFVIRGLVKLRPLYKNLPLKQAIFVEATLLMAITGIFYPVSLLLSFVYRIRVYPNCKIEFKYLLICLAAGIFFLSFPIAYDFYQKHLDESSPARVVRINP